jgi:hypothetical protein
MCLACVQFCAIAARIFRAGAHDEAVVQHGSNSLKRFFPLFFTWCCMYSSRVSVLCHGCAARRHQACAPSSSRAWSFFCISYQRACTIGVSLRTACEGFFALVSLGTVGDIAYEQHWCVRMVLISCNCLYVTQVCVRPTVSWTSPKQHATVGFV